MSSTDKKIEMHLGSSIPYRWPGCNSDISGSQWTDHCTVWAV